ncbi:MAG: GGDEF domain-containing protein [Christensenellaceae bacterium]|nr:GGDEF domain-containing protein [Christensenellaceae bacterium]
MEKAGSKKKLRIINVYIIALTAIVFISALIIVHIGDINTNFLALRDNITNYSDYQTAFSDMKDASAFLTSESRYFVATGNTAHLNAYMTEVNDVKRREKSLDIISGGDYGKRLSDDIVRATTMSDELAQVEMYAMSLAAQSYGIDISDTALNDTGIELSKEDLALTPDEQKDKALDMLFNDHYAEIKSTIESSVYDGTSKLVGQIEADSQQSLSKLSDLLVTETVLTLLLVGCAVAAILITLLMLAIPMRKGIDAIGKDEKLDTRGSYEYAALAEAYNRMHDKKAVSMEVLSYEASHDELTGIYNRKMFEQKRMELMSGDCALIIIDVDLFKSINDTYGHSTGDMVICRTAKLLSESFRSNDYVCRIGGDEFAVLLSSIKPGNEKPILDKIQTLRDNLKNQPDIPEVTLSIGMAFRENDSADDLFRRADAALYESKRQGRNRTTLYSPGMEMNN